MAATRYSHGMTDSDELDTESIIKQCISAVTAKMAANDPVDTPDWPTLRIYTDTINTNWPDDLPTINLIGVVIYSVDTV